MTNDSLQRYDISDVGDRLDTALTEDGKIRARCCITNVGVFTYRNSDGTLRRELRCPEEVFKQDSVDSLNGVPVTNLHHGMVDASNEGSLKVGRLDSDVTSDAYHLYATVNVEDEESVKEVVNGAKRGLSAGYRCRLDWTSGTWMGVHYDCIQRDIRYNHVALVPKGRAGDDAVIHMDGADDCVCVGIETKTEEPTMEKRTIRMDGADVEVDATVAAFIEKQDAAIKDKEGEIARLNEDMASVKAEKDKIEAERDSLKSERDSFKEHADSMERDFPELVNKAVKSRLALVAKVQAVGVEVKEDMGDAEILGATIAKAYPDRNLEGKSKDYIESCFDCALDKLSESIKKSDKNSRQDSADVPDEREDGCKGKGKGGKRNCEDEYRERVQSLAMKR